MAQADPSRGIQSSGECCSFARSFECQANCRGVQMRRIIPLVAPFPGYLLGLSLLSPSPLRSEPPLPGTHGQREHEMHLRSVRRILTGNDHVDQHCPASVAAEINKVILQSPAGRHGGPAWSMPCGSVCSSTQRLEGRQ